MRVKTLQLGRVLRIAYKLPGTKSDGYEDMKCKKILVQSVRTLQWEFFYFNFYITKTQKVSFDVAVFTSDATQVSYGLQLGTITLQCPK